MTKAKIMIGTVIGIGISAPLVWQFQTNHSLRLDNIALRQTIGELQQKNEHALSQIQKSANESTRLLDERLELARLRSEVARLKTAPQAARTSPDPARSHPERVAEPVTVTEQEAEQFLQLPASEQGRQFGTFRRQVMRGKIESAEEFQRRQALAKAIRPQLEALESRPADMAAFQSAFIKEVVGLEDEQKVAQIRDLVQSTFEQAVANGVAASSRPEGAADEWAKQRDALDRPATRQLQALLSAEDRARFDRAFLGIMGIDLGIGDGSWHRFKTPDGATVFPSEQKASDQP